MAFQQIPYEEKGADFNSALSANFLSLVSKLEEQKYSKARSKVSHKTFAPSSFKCQRIQFFRLRGVEPDKEQRIDPGTEFTAMLGDAVHEDIQKTLRDGLGDGWFDVAEYLNSQNIEASVTKSDNGLETLVEFENPPIRFAVDGLLQLNPDDKPVLFECKSIELDSLRTLSDVRDRHVEQVKCYLSLLRLDRALVLYIERRYGGKKCFEYDMNAGQRERVLHEMDYIVDCANNNIAPPKLPSGDPTCAYCKYKKSCKEW